MSGPSFTVSSRIAYNDFRCVGALYAGDALPAPVCLVVGSVPGSAL